MPHVIVEYSSNVAAHHDVDALLDVIHEAVLKLDIAPIPGIRIRGIEHTNTRIADGSDQHHAYIAMIARIGPGRDAETKMHLITTVLDAAEAHLARAGGPLLIAWSFEVQEIDAEFRVNRNKIAQHMKNRIA